MKFHLAENTPNPIKLVVVFRAYNDEIGFRYELPKKDHKADYESMYNCAGFNLSDEN